MAIARQVKQTLADKGRIPAVRLALAEVAPLLREPSDELRFAIRRAIFAPLTASGVVSYQINDFECFDYQLYSLAGDLPTFRGPRITAAHLQAGDYACVIGAAQTFGRLVDQPFGARLSAKLDLPILNLSRGGAGPDFFLDERLLRLARGARFVIVQVMSGRSSGCPDYPGGKIVDFGDGRPPVERRVADRSALAA